jgi:SAM-dependent methyltransferase
MKLRLLDRFKLNDLDRIYAQEMFLDRKEGAWYQDVRHFCRVLQDRFRPTSVADVGCGPGVYLASFKAFGVAHVLGIEGSTNAVKQAVVSDIVQHDLRDPFMPPRRYDVVLCIEVAEHLHKRYSRRLVDTATRLCEPGGAVIFTAAPPGQDGVHHINLQPKEFWIELFRRAGFDHSRGASDELRERLTLDRMPWVKRNLMVFRRAP